MSSLLRQALDNKHILTDNDNTASSEGSTSTTSLTHSDPDTYTCVAGDTLTSVSLKNNISTASLKKFNRLYGRNSLFTGQLLQLRDPSLQPSTWTNVTASVDELAIAAAASPSLSHSLTGTSTPTTPSFTKLKDLGGNKHVSFIEKERLKSKSALTHTLTPTSSTSSLKGISSSFKYSHSSNPDLKSLDQMRTLTTAVTVQPDIPTKRRQSTIGDSTAHAHAHDWCNFADLEDGSSATPPLPLPLPIPPSQQPTTANGSSSLSSVPKALLFGTLEMLDSYFPGTFTPPVHGTVSQLDGDNDNETDSNPAACKFHQFHTELHGNSSILLHSHIQCLVEHFPASLQYEAWDLAFSTDLHGSDLVSFYNRSSSYQYTLLVVRTMDNQIFGGFATEPWRITRHGSQVFYGSGESFLFKCHPSTGEEDENDCPENDNVDVYVWQYDNYFFQWSNSKQIAMGGGGGCFGFVLDDDFAYAETNPCETFGNPHLTSHTSPFAVADVELWGFGIRATSTQTEDVMNSGGREHMFMMNYESQI